MTPRELAASLTDVLVTRDGAASVSITPDWVLFVHGISYSVGVKLAPSQRSPEGAIAAIAGVAPWALPWGRGVAPAVLEEVQTRKPGRQT
jgi:hypothetical protein